MRGGLRRGKKKGDRTKNEESALDGSDRIGEVDRKKAVSNQKDFKASTRSRVKKKSFFFLLGIN